MRYLRLALAGVFAASVLPAAWASDVYYDGAVGGPAPLAHGYAAGCETCGNGSGYGHHAGWGVPGCCERPVSKAYGLWDGYCSRKGHGFGRGHGHECNECDHGHQGCGNCSGGWLFRLFGHRCNACSSCTSSSDCSSCISGGYPAAPVAPGAPAAGALDTEDGPPVPPQPPVTGRAKSRRAL